MAKSTRLKSAAVRSKGGGAAVKTSAPVSPAPFRSPAGKAKKAGPRSGGKRKG